MPEKSPDSQLKPISNKAFKKKLLKDGNYFPNPNDLFDAYCRHDISHHCKFLVELCLRHQESFRLTYSYLLRCFSNNKRTLASAQREAVAKNLISIKKINKYNYYTVKDMSEWNLKAKVSDDLQGEKSHFNDLQSDNSHGEIHHGDNSHGEKSHPIIRRTPKKKNLGSKNDDEEEGASSSLKRNKSSWVAKLIPSEAVNLFKNNGLLPREKNGHVNQIDDFNEAFSLIFAHRSDAYIFEIANKAANRGIMLPRDLNAMRSCIEALDRSDP